jgi:site-specific DNA-methyltransferase (adenine-specific)
MNGTWGARQLSSIGYHGTDVTEYRTQQHPSSRWPANVCLDEAAAAALDQQSGVRPGMPRTTKRQGTSQAGYDGGWKDNPAEVSPGYGDTGGASRFFYTAKSSRAERNAGLEGMPELSRAERTGRQMGNNSELSLNGSGNPVNGTGMRNPSANHHPTVKPISLMRWLVRLVTPPGGIVLDPFAGSGTTGCAAALEGFQFIGIEREAEYVAIAERRIAHWGRQPALLGVAS